MSSKRTGQELPTKQVDDGAADDDGERFATVQQHRPNQRASSDNGRKTPHELLPENGRVRVDLVKMFRERRRRRDHQQNEGGHSLPSTPTRTECARSNFNEGRACGARNGQSAPRRGSFVEPPCTPDFVRICAPMVRYSKLAFRNVVRRHGVDIAYTPMIVAESFVDSNRARQADFFSSLSESAVVAQFAASSAHHFAQACELMAPYADAIDLNCGCPQKWAMQEGIGAHLVKRPELIADMVKAAKARVACPITVKIRLCPTKQRDKDTVELCRRAEMCGASWIAVHGRTYKERKSPVHYDAIALIKDALSIPVVANGDVFTLEDANRIVQETNVDGVMCARGLLANPALFDGTSICPSYVIEEYVNEAVKCGTLTNILHHHIIYMTESLLGRAERQEFNRLTSTPAIIKYLRQHYGLFPEHE